MKRLKSSIGTLKGKHMHICVHAEKCKCTYMCVFATGGFKYFFLKADGH